MTKVSLKVIGLGFTYMYFEGMKKNPGKVSNFYSDDSEFVFVDVSKLDGQFHETFPVVKLHNKASIKEYFDTNSTQLKSTKLKIKTFDSQSITGDTNSILMLTLTGEVIWDSTQAYNFTQTFILKNLKDEEQVYEVSNSVFRITTEVGALPSTTNKYRNVSYGRNKSKNEHYNNNSNGHYSRNRSSVSMNNYEDAANNNNVMFYPQNMMMNEYYQYPNYIPNNFGYYNANMDNNTNNYPKYSGRKYSNSRYDKTNERNSNNHTTNKDNNRNKINYHSVHVKNTRDLTEDQIKDTLENEFGPIGKITTGENFTIVGFENSSSATNCLAKKENTIDGSVITFEKQ